MALDYLSIARSAMSTFRLGMNIAGYNVANANTEGFTRRRLVLGPLPEVQVRNGIVGTGVDVMSVTRVRDRFVDTNVRSALAQMGTEKSRQDILSGLEPVLGSVKTPALSNALSNLFGAFETLTIQADSPASRADVLARAGELASTFRRADAAISDAQREADTRLQDAVGRANDIIGQLRQMNVDVVQQEAGGLEASDLRDRRDQLVDELSELLPVRTVEQDNGQISVYMEGTGDTLLATVSARPLRTTTDVNGHAHVIVDRGGQSVDVSGTLRAGEIGGLLKAREDDLQGYRDQLDQLATAVITEFNAIHKAGFDLDGGTGNALFVPDPPGTHAAAAIAVNPTVAQDPRKLAAADTAGEPGNNKNAQKFVGLRTRDLPALGLRNLVAFSADLLADVGRAVKNSEVSLTASQTIVDSLNEKRSQLSGVSLDEEAADLVRWQQAFQASARFLQMANQMVDEALDRLSR